MFHKTTLIPSLISFVALATLVSGCEVGSSLETSETVVPAGAAAQEMGILEYRVTDGDKTTVRLIGANDVEYGVLSQWTDDSDTNYTHVAIAGVPNALEMQTRVDSGEVSNDFFVSGEARGQLFQSAAGDDHSDDLFLEDVVEHLDAMTVVRGDAQLKDVLGDPSEEFVLYGSCPGIAQQLLSCGVCALSKTVCLLSPDRATCFAQARASNDCQACVCK